MKIKDKTVLQNLSSGGFGLGANIGCVDVKDGKVVRVYPHDSSKEYTEEELNAWRFTHDGHVFDPGMKTTIAPFNIAYKQRTYSPNRILRPLKRVDWDPEGDRHPEMRGISGYEEISWDEATRILVKEVDRIKKEYGTKAILVQPEGHGETKVVGGAHGCMTMLLDHINDEPGEYTIQARQPDSWEGWYWGAKHVWGGEPIGQQAKADNVMLDVTKNSDAILYWGCDLETTPWGWGGQLPSRLAFWFTEIGKLNIHISPDCNYTNCIHADKWIPVLPNTDAALQLAIAYVWITEDLYDKEYVDTHVVGFDWFEYHVLGREDGIPKTPEWASEKCGVPVHRIKSLARYWGKHRVSIAHCNGGGYIRSVYSHEPARLEACLLAMQGVGKPGVNQFKFLEWNGLGDVNPLPANLYLPQMFEAFHGLVVGECKHIIPKTMSPEAILKGEISWYGDVLCVLPRENQFEPRHYPEEDGTQIHMIWSDTPCWQTCWNGGFLYEDAVRSESIQTYVIMHPWMENDCWFADLLFPVATIFENEDDIASDVLSGQFVRVVYEEKAIEPLGESLCDYYAVGRIAKAFEEFSDEYAGLYEKYTKGRTTEEDVKVTYEKSGVPTDLYPYDEFKEQGYIALPVDPDWEKRPAGLFEFYKDPENHPLQTPTGKIEFYSQTLAEKFPDDKIRAPWPHWIENGDGHDERIGGERAKKYPYLLVSNHPRWRVHAQHDDMPWLREIPTCKIRGKDGYLYEPIWVNPIDAEKVGVEDGDIARLYNERGSVLGAVWVTERIMPGALYQDHGARTDVVKSGTGGWDRGGANNLIAPNKTTSKNAAGEVTNGFLVGLEKVDIDELREKHPTAFERDYDPYCGLTLSACLGKEAKSE